MTTPQRGEIYWLDFDPATGAEMRNLHPALVIQNDIGNQASALTIVAAITSNLQVARLPVGVLIDAGEGGLPRASVAHLGHIYSVDKNRLRRRIGLLSADRMRQIDDAIAIRSRPSITSAFSMGNASGNREVILGQVLSLGLRPFVLDAAPTTARRP